jgi:CheY-like chemotaxis protein
MRTILFVDDEKDTVLIFSMLLSARGYHVETAHDGQQALLEIERSPTDVIVTDWAMPGMDGATLCATLRAPGSPYASIPVIVASAALLSIEADRPPPYDRVLRKPYSADELVREIEGLVSTHPETSDEGRKARR